MNALFGSVGELKMTLEITRAATGKTETVDLVGHLDAGQIEALTEQQTPQPSADAQKED